MAQPVKLLGVFPCCSSAASAVRSIRNEQLGELVVYSPTPDHRLDNALEAPVSSIRLFVLIGGLLGCAIGFAFPIYTVLEWPLITGGKALISIPPFVVIAFEMTILLGALGGMAGFLWLSKLPRMTGNSAPDKRFTNDMTGISVTCSPEQAESVRMCFERTGVSEIRELS